MPDLGAPSVPVAPTPAETGEVWIIRDKLSALVHTERLNRRGVLFVHGFTGDAATWTHGTAPSFQQLIRNDPDLSDFDVFTFQYKTKWRKGSPIELLARQLAGAMDQLREWAEKGGRRHELVLIAHSMGGLVCMRYILDQLLDHHIPPIGGVLLYQTPTTGSELVNVARYAGAALGMKVPVVRSVLGLALRGQHQIMNMKPASEFMQRLHDQWARHVLNGGHESAVTDRMWLPVRVLTGNGNLVVSQASGKGLYGAIDWKQVDYNHIQICKPVDRSDERYLYARSFLKDCREAKSTDVLDCLNQLSGKVWGTRNERLIRGWTYTAELFTNTLRTDQQPWLANGFSGCTIERCEYTTRLTGRDIVVAAAIGRTATQTAWQHDPEPFYVHQVNIEGVPQADQNRLSQYVDHEFSGLDGAACWEKLFARFAIAIVAGPGNQPRAVTPDYVATERFGTALVRRYRIPPAADDLVGEDVRVVIKYDAVIPDALDSFNAFFPWLTQGCDLNVVVWKGTSFVVALPRTLMAGALAVHPPERYEHRFTVQATSRELLLKGSELAIRWGTRARA